MNWLNQLGKAGRWLNDKVLSGFGLVKRIGDSQLWKWGVNQAKQFEKLAPYANIAEDALRGVNQAGDIYKQAQTDPQAALHQTANKFGPMLNGLLQR